MRLAYIVLAHSGPENVARLVRRLVEGGGLVALHYDLKAAGRDMPKLRAMLEGVPDVVFVEAVSVQWGHWSIVRATLNAIEALKKTNVEIDYVHLMSGMDYPVKPLKSLDRFLQRSAGLEFIEAKNINNEKWVSGGLEHERYQYKHIHNWQTERKKFDKYWQKQEAAKQERPFLPGIAPYLGSQWWTLTWATCLGALAWSEDVAVSKFFETVWVPDEMFFQTYVGNNISPDNIIDLNLTFYQFDPNGVPVVYYDDHFEYLNSQNFFFARKLHPRAVRLRDNLDKSLSMPQRLTVQDEKNLGRQTSEYSSFVEKHRRGLPNRRRVGFAEDAWYGDLEWNRRPYIVIVSASRPAAERVQAVLAGTGVFACHGELFGPGRIEFRAGQKRFAGYSETDIALRGQMPQNFLVDVVQADAPHLTSFLLIASSPNKIHEVLPWDPRAHFVLVDVGAVDVFLDQKQGAASATSEPRRSKNGALDSAVQFALFSKKFFAERAIHLPALRALLAKRHKRTHRIDRFGDTWEHDLREMLIGVLGLSIDGEIDTSGIFAQMKHATGTKPAKKLDLARILNLVTAVANMTERDRLLRPHFAPVERGPQPYVAVFAPAAAESEIGPLLSRLMPAVGWLTVTASPAADDSAIEHRYSIASARYRLDNVEASKAALVFGMIAGDPRAKVIILHGAPGAVAGPDAGMEALEGMIRDLGRTRHKAIMTIDLQDRNWLALFGSFVEVLAREKPEAAGDEDQLDDAASDLPALLEERRPVH
jgi:hypothetical protein